MPARVVFLGTRTMNETFYSLPILPIQKKRHTSCLLSLTFQSRIRKFGNKTGKCLYTVWQSFLLQNNTHCEIILSIAISSPLAFLQPCWNILFPSLGALQNTCIECIHKIFQNNSQSDEKKNKHFR